jgi:DNA polymerase-3 subunit epsilon
MLGFDIESTGVSAEDDRIVSASLVNVIPGQGRLAETVYINPGVPIPQGAVDIHGITNEWIQQNGEAPATGVETVTLVLAAVLRDHDQPIVGHNVVYDLTMLDRECRRHGVVPLCDRVDVWPVIDTLVLDKAVDRFRKGTGMRKLEAIAQLYNVPRIGQAHTSEADAYTALAVAYRIGTMYRPVGELTLEQLHAWQKELKVGQDKSLASWLKGQKRPHEDCTGEWPYRTFAIEPTDDLVDVPLW